MSVTSEEVRMFTDQLLKTVEEGHSLVRSLILVAKQQPNQDMKQIVKGVNSAVKAGKTLSYALARYPDVFDQNYVATVKRGEQGDDLWEIMKALA